VRVCESKKRARELGRDGGGGVCGARKREREKDRTTPPSAFSCPFAHGFYGS
jgi:hypothetical protein